MKKKIIFILWVSVIFLTSSLYALSIRNIVAYPVPFNPNNGVKYITIDEPGNSPIGNFNIKINIYDINGDNVYSSSADSFPVRWNARNEKGLMVKPGLYIIKLQVEDRDNGSFQKKMIRILVRY